MSDRKACPNCGYVPERADQRRMRVWCEEYRELKNQGLTDRQVAEALGYDPGKPRGMETFFIQVGRMHDRGLL